MPQLTFPLTSGEPKRTVLVGVGTQHAQNHVGSGQAIPRSLWVSGHIDTGTNIKCVAQSVLSRLAVPAVGQGMSQTAGGQLNAALYQVSLSIPPLQHTPGQMLTYNDLTVLELAHPIPDVDVLIGMDVLLGCRLLIDGPGREFTLSFGP